MRHSLILPRFLIIIASLCCCLSPMTIIGQTYFLTGDATALGDDCYQLTPDIGNSVGTVWYADQINLDAAFDLQFLMNFGVYDASGADGICFVLQTVGTDATGMTGGGLGYMNFGTSLGIEFDTWQNTEYGDPAYDHIAIEMNGEIDHLTDEGNIGDPVQADANDENIEDFEDHVVRITWDPGTTSIAVYFDCEFRISSVIDLKNVIFGGNNLVYWGFTAATGGSVNIQTVCLQENVVTLDQEVNMCEGESVVLTAWDSSDGVYEWSPAGEINNPTAQSVTVSPEVTTDYYVSFLDACGVETELTYTVIVSELYSADLGDDLLITCNDPQQTLTAETDGENAEFSWLLNGNTIPGENGSTLEVEQPGDYTVIVMNSAEGCESSDEIEVGIDLSTPLITIGEQDSLSCAKQVVVLQNVNIISDNEFTFSWTGPDGDSYNELLPQVTQSGEYMLTAVDAETGCASEGLAIVNIEDSFDLDFSSLTFPNVISANGDSKNDVWEPFLASDPGYSLSGAFSEFRMSIYNRWGSLMYESDNAGSQWRGDECEPGVYFYIAEYTTYCYSSNSAGIATGHIELIK